MKSRRMGLVQSVVAVESVICMLRRLIHIGVTTVIIAGILKTLIFAGRDK